MKILTFIFILSLGLYAGGDKNRYVSQVTDINTGVCKANKVYIEKDAQLMWQDQAYTDAETGAYKRNHSVEKAGSWNHAQNYCAGLDYQGHDDWRLPTSDELRHVHHASGQVFTYHRTEDFWTSTPATENRYYVVYPVDAYQYKRKRKESNYIRCVRCWVPVKKGNLSRIIRDKVNNIAERN
jgi:hypothetical protein